jgi:hypothetical protein
VATHAALLMQAPVDEFVSRANVFLANLQNEISLRGIISLVMLSKAIGNARTLINAFV